MKKKTINIWFKTFKEINDESKKSVEKSGKFIQQKEDIFFDTPESVIKFLSVNKIIILVAIKKFKPESLECLASKTGIDLKEVQKKCFSLSLSGFLKKVEIDWHYLSLSNFLKEFKKPELSFPYDTIEVHMPNGLNWSYRI